MNEDCVGCGMCAKICSVGNIVIENGTVVFQDHCNQCMACIQWCGKRAIVYDVVERSRKRYHNLNVKAGELAGDDLIKASDNKVCIRHI